ncbi:DUF6002 family protein [Streptomyces sp. SCSIO 30461]|uniref:DUF6002 family protein n=1 Tax=Streptomyces sp. SCSIO 30461 TaxID=3118085 RepID=UPI0030CF1A3E
MCSAEQSADAPGVVPCALDRYFHGIAAAARAADAERETAPLLPLELVEKPPGFAEFAAVSDIGLTRVEQRTYLLDLTRNPGTRTTKTLASLLMVARAAAHVRKTGERVLFLTPTSGNKGMALRDAVARAYTSGLASPEEVRSAVLVPAASRYKFRDSALNADPALRAANPVLVADVGEPSEVKAMAGRVLTGYADRVFDTTGFRLCYTHDLDNYRVGDATRAFAEAELLPLTPESASRVHAHAVSSAFGLLGYHLGHRMLTEGMAGFPRPASHPAFLLVQQLATPDLVTSLGVQPPEYAYDAAAALWRQSSVPSVPEFPAATDDPQEVIDPTFWTRRPATSALIGAVIRRHGGGGVVVSKRECIERLDRVRGLVAEAGIAIARDPSLIQEWSLVKAFAGVLVARERGLIAESADVVVHGAGYYSDDLIDPFPAEHLGRADTTEELAGAVLAAARV